MSWARLPVPPGLSGKGVRWAEFSREVPSISVDLSTVENVWIAFKKMPAQSLHISIHAKRGNPSPEDPSRCRWQVTISTENQTIPNTKNLLDPFSSQKKADCQWYIEEFARKEPYSVGRAERFEDALEDYATSLFQDLRLVEIIPAELRNTLPRFPGAKLAVLLSIYDEGSEGNSVHRLHWELLENSSVWGLDVEVTVRRVITPCVDVDSIREQSKAAVLVDKSSFPIINGLLMTARDLSKDTSMYKDISPNLTLGILSRFQDYLSKQKLGTCLNLDVVRPGSLDALDQHLRTVSEAHGRTGSYYHFIHLDLRGIITASLPLNCAIDNSNSTDHNAKSPKMSAYLLFNNSDPDNLKTKGVSAGIVGKILVKYGIRIAVLNASESAREDVGESANLARAFMNSGVENVLAMSFSVNRSAAEIFLRAFYHRLLLKGLPFSRAASMGREALRFQPERDARMGLKRKVLDHFVPVVYSARGIDSHFVVSSDKRRALITALQSSAFTLGAADPNQKKELPFIGREFDLLRLEKQLLVGGRVYLSGRSGVGRTSLLHYASKLWIQTSFVDSVIFLDFTTIKNC